MENPQINNDNVNPLNSNTTGSNSESLHGDYQKPETQTGGTGSNRSLPTDGPLRQNLDDEPDLTDNDNLTDDDEFETELDTDHDADLELFDDDLELDGDSDDLNSDVEDDDLDTLDGPLLDENNPRH